MSKALEQAKESIVEIADRPAAPCLTQFDTVLQFLPHGAISTLDQVHARGFHGHTIEQTAAMLIEAALLNFLPEKFEWCQPAETGKVGIRR